MTSPQDGLDDLGTGHTKFTKIILPKPFFGLREKAVLKRKASPKAQREGKNKKGNELSVLAIAVILFDT